MNADHLPREGESLRQYVARLAPSLADDVSRDEPPSEPRSAFRCGLATGLLSVFFEVGHGAGLDAVLAEALAAFNERDAASADHPAGSL